MQEELITMLEQKRFHELSRLLRDQTGPDIAALVDEIPAQYLPLVYRLLPKDLAADAFVSMDPDVQEYVMSFEETRVFLDKLYDMMDFLIPLYIKEGKGQLVIALGCTGGMHRSVMIAEEITARLLKDGHKAHVTHRDIMRDRGPAR